MNKIIYQEVCMLFRKILAVSVPMLCFMPAIAQDAMHAAGGDASGSGGSASYSIGQVFFNVHTSAEGSVIEGVQQPYEISIVTGTDEADDIALNYRAYPNPTTGFLVLKVENSGEHNLQYQLVETNGSIILQDKITGNDCTVPMERYKAGTYYLNVISGDKKVMTFKIIKN